MDNYVAYELNRVQGMNEALARNWWTLALRGGAAVIFGVLSFMMPMVTLASMVMLLAIYLLVDGVFSMVAGMRAARRDQRWVPFTVEGIVGIVGGVATLTWPTISIFALVFLIAVWSVLTGLAEIMSAWRMHRSHGKWIWGAAGALSVVFGLSMWVLPQFGMLALSWGVAFYALAFGVLELLMAFRLRRCLSEQHGHSGMAAPAE